MIMVVSTMVIVLVTVSLSGALRTKQTRIENNQIVRNAFEGGLDYVRDLAARGILRLPQTTAQIGIGSAKVTMTLTDASKGATINLLGTSITTPVAASLIKVDGSILYQGQTYRLQAIVGRGLLNTVWQCAFYDDSSLFTLANVTSNNLGTGGDVWIDGNATLGNGASHIGGNLTATGTILAFGVAVDGSKTPNSDGIPFPNVDDKANNYKDVALVKYGSNTTLNGYVFPAADSTTGYPVVYIDGKLNISGSFSGSGVIVANDDVTITGNITSTGGGHLVIITTGNINVNSSVTSVDGYIYTKGTLNIPSFASPTTFTDGVVANNASFGSTVRFNNDPFATNNPVEAYKLHLPGVWP